MGEIELDAFLADSVASVQGKLYALGAGWNRIASGSFRRGTTASGSGSCSGSRGSAVEVRRFELRLLGPPARSSRWARVRRVRCNASAASSPRAATRSRSS